LPPTFVVRIDHTLPVRRLTPRTPIVGPVALQGCRNKAQIDVPMAKSEHRSMHDSISKTSAGGVALR
jgi:hypothetical protein